MESKTCETSSPKSSSRPSSSSFEERFEQVLTFEISPQLLVTVHRLKVNNSLFVDIRRRRELRVGGKKLHVPTKFGAFLRKSEFDEIRSIARSWIDGKKESDIPAVLESQDGRQVLFGKGQTQRFKIKLHTPSKISELELSSIEMERVVSYSLSENLAFALTGVDYEN